VVPFSAVAAFGETVDVLTHGPMTLMFECVAGEEAGDEARLLVVSSVQDMVITGRGASEAGEPNLGGPVPKGVIEHLFIATSFDSQMEASRPGYTVADRNGPSSGVSMITPSGYVLTVPIDSVGFGFSFYDFSPPDRNGWKDAPDCLMTGFALLSKAALLP
jgi:hypothetical protein